MKNKFYIIILSVFIVLAGEGLAHHKSMITKNTPKPPPTIDPGPDAALIKVNITDKISGEPLSATACVNDGDQEPDKDPYHRHSLRRSANRHKGPIRFRKINYYFYTDGYFEVRVPPGNVTIEISKGYEYNPVTVELVVKKKEVREIHIQMERAIHMSALGWYSGDTHIHMERTGNNDDTLLTITSAKDIQYAYLLSMNTEGYDQGKKYESWLQEKGIGEQSVANKGRYHITSGQEYRTNRLGHISLIMNNAYVPGIGSVAHTDSGPSLGVIADQAHDLEGFVALNHGGYPDQEGDGVLLEDKMDFLELLQFGGYRSLGLDGWYDYLNIGFRLPIVGACDYPYTRELGSELTYVWSKSTPSPRTFAQGLAEGRSFATSGPMLFLEVGDKKPGEILTYPEKSEINLPISIHVESPVYPVRFLEIIVNGRVVDHYFSQQPKKTWNFKSSLNVNKSSWIAARTYAEAGTEAHTNPVYIYLGKQLPFDHHSVHQIIARLEDSIKTIPNHRIVTRLIKLKQELQKMLNEQKTDLPLPFIPELEK